MKETIPLRSYHIRIMIKTPFFSIIRQLKMHMCRVWYDEGLHAGESWNKEIADHLKTCSAVMVFLSPDSVKSKYVFKEINYAVSKDKKIIPVLLKKTDIPSEIELLISDTHYLDITNTDDISNICAAMIDRLPKNIISLDQMPFLVDSGYSFYIRTQNVDREEMSTKHACSIVCANEDGEELELFHLDRLGAYEVKYSLSALEPFKDYFYSGKITGSFQINLKGQFFLEYPLYGPDVDVLLICVLRIPRHSVPTFKLVDYQYLESVSSLTSKDEEDLNVVGEKGWSASIKKYLETILYK